MNDREKAALAREMIGKVGIEASGARTIVELDDWLRMIEKGELVLDLPPGNTSPIPRMTAVDGEPV